MSPPCRMLPLVQRELKSAARNPKLYRWRLRVAAGETLLALLAVAAHDPFSSLRIGGLGFFWLLAFCALVFCLGEGLRKTADTISEEKREGTLGLLFLTELGGADIVLGKLAGALLRSFNGLLAFLPILAVTLLLGGTLLSEFWRVAVVLINALWHSLTVCLLVSSVSRERSLFSSTCTLAALTGGPLLAGALLNGSGQNGAANLVFCLSPAYLLYAADDRVYATLAGSFWAGLAIQQILPITALISASLIVPRTWRDRALRSDAALKPRTLGTPELARQKRTRLLDRNPVYWLTYNERQHRFFNALYFGIAAAFLLGVASIQLLPGLRDDFYEIASVSLWAGAFVLALVLHVFAASQAASNFAESKRNGAMELLMSTPLRIANITSGQWLALRKMFAPALVVLVLWTFFTLLLSIAAGPYPALWWLGKTFIDVILGFFAAGWVGMWMGISSQSPNRAFFKTLLITLLLPYAIACVPNMIIYPVLVLVARDKVQWNFRRFIAERYLQQSGFVLAPIVNSVRRTAPPPLTQPGAVHPPASQKG